MPSVSVGQIRSGSNKDGQIRFGQMRSRPSDIALSIKNCNRREDSSDSELTKTDSWPTEQVRTMARERILVWPQPKKPYDETDTFSCQCKNDWNRHGALAGHPPQVQGVEPAHQVDRTGIWSPRHHPTVDEYPQLDTSSTAGGQTWDETSLNPQLQPAHRGVRNTSSRDMRKADDSPRSLDEIAKFCPLLEIFSNCIHRQRTAMRRSQMRSRIEAHATWLWESDRGRLPPGARRASAPWSHGLPPLVEQGRNWPKSANKDGQSRIGQSRSQPFHPIFMSSMMCVRALLVLVLSFSPSPVSLRLLPLLFLILPNNAEDLNHCTHAEWRVLLHRDIQSSHSFFFTKATKADQHNQRCKRATEKIVDNSSVKQAKTNSNHELQSGSDQQPSINRNTFWYQCHVVSLRTMR